ncbi:hypothetical protein [Tsukamurella sp. PLM1]|uniref:hypothetical protein n=1 Tax=Tsukamurella sp. PLM1 TaxID=2929795 RepID=UPI002061CD6E|nr:hypothetical protein [Tsukamurella sp. PLM1]BDH57191.1 hypothetical protein MTP03_21300 [Tsukamurella sp. PLM1]
MTRTRTALRRVPALALVAALLLGAGGAAVWETGRAETVHGATALGVPFGALERDEAAERRRRRPSGPTRRASPCGPVRAPSS